MFDRSFVTWPTLSLRLPEPAIQFLANSALANRFMVTTMTFQQPATHKEKGIKQTRQRCTWPLRVIGRRCDVAAYAGLEILNIDNACWSSCLNRAWIDNGIRLGYGFILASRLTSSNLHTHEHGVRRHTVFALELDQLFAAGYTAQQHTILLPAMQTGLTQHAR
jgi:hypothetical protein